MKKLPQYLEYFLYDVLDGNKNFSVKKLFSSYGIYKNKIIFAIYANSQIRFKKNENNKKDFLKKGYKQFSYKRKGKIVFLPYFTISEEIIENKDLLLKEIEKAIYY